MDEGALAELKRRAYSADGLDALAARAELSELDRERREADRLTRELALDPPAVPRARASVLIALGCVTIAAAGLATAHALGPPPSLTVFDRPPTSKDAEASDIGFLQLTDPVESTRWLGGTLAVDAYAYLAGDTVCLSLEQQGGSGVSCDTVEAFQHQGLTLTSLRIAGQGADYITVIWGPTGDARFSDAPLSEVPR